MHVADADCGRSARSTGEGEQSNDKKTFDHFGNHPDVTDVARRASLRDGSLRVGLRYEMKAPKMSRLDGRG
ncbi:MAG: hypothetical protein JHC61_02480 [Burkholderiaceae bacterium]|nr:hypothetical protein [Burkholderiaceae bacterium]